MQQATVTLTMSRTAIVNTGKNHWSVKNSGETVHDIESTYHLVVREPDFHKPVIDVAGNHGPSPLFLASGHRLCVFYCYKGTGWRQKFDSSSFLLTQHRQFHHEPIKRRQIILLSKTK